MRTSAKPGSAKGDERKQRARASDVRATTHTRALSTPPRTLPPRKRLPIKTRFEGSSHKGQFENPRARTRAQQDAFLEQFAAIGVITAACKLVGIDRQRHYEWMAASDKYPDYAERFANAVEEAADRAEAEMVRRGIQGWEEPVYGKLPGRETGFGVIGSRRLFSDRMLELCLKARRPEKFRERMEHTGAGGGAIKMDVDLTKVSTERLRQMREWLKEAAVGTQAAAEANGSS